ncbi:hypothetical protein M427DRAFT_43935 [Gonapodya prolifera JEL478]|uniref:Uncharacterized protein n=1 Tax=Gonapodya prolifera (strain JEL478) TaxID=1344416 RepID=A0A139AH32_GONPJ|nr:hypothetical protein M427DRAFT_43935 [Gonapodya prolifera JEL478]|eukprot:KXS16121.1 hypothetical protein M427DRAFT_43935 [Gonapodya prolifera JEL478]
MSRHSWLILFLFCTFYLKASRCDVYKFPFALSELRSLGELNEDRSTTSANNDHCLVLGKRLLLDGFKSIRHDVCSPSRALQPPYQELCFESIVPRQPLSSSAERAFRWYLLSGLDPDAQFELRVSYPATSPSVFEACFFLVERAEFERACSEGSWKGAALPAHAESVVVAALNATYTGVSPLRLCGFQLAMDRSYRQTVIALDALYFGGVPFSTMPTIAIAALAVLLVWLFLVPVVIQFTQQLLGETGGKPKVQAYKTMHGCVAGTSLDCAIVPREVLATQPLSYNLELNTITCPLMAEKSYAPITIYELVGADPLRRFSPFVWQVLFILEHKGLKWKGAPWRFTDPEVEQVSGQKLVPVIIDPNHLDGYGKPTIVSDSWKIVEYLEDNYPDLPSVFVGGHAGRTQAMFFRQWVLHSFGSLSMAIIAKDIHDHLAEKDKQYFRESREKRLGRSLELAVADRETLVDPFRNRLEPARATLKSGAKFLTGDAPGYADYVLMGYFMWLRNTSSFAAKLLEKDDPVELWRDR